MLCRKISYMKRILFTVLICVLMMAPSLVFGAKYIKKVPLSYIAQSIAKYERGAGREYGLKGQIYKFAEGFQKDVGAKPYFPYKNTVQFIIKGIDGCYFRQYTKVRNNSPLTATGKIVNCNSNKYPYIKPEFPGKFR